MVRRGSTVRAPDPRLVLRVGEARGAAAWSGALTVEVLQKLVCCELDLLVPPLRREVVAGDQPHPVQTAEVAVDERVACLRLLGRTAEMRVYIWCDGAAMPNGGPAGAGYVVVGGVRLLGSDALGDATNNVAEYTAVRNALRAAADAGATSVSTVGSK